MHASLLLMTAAQLSDKHFEITGKNIKAASYTKAKWIEMIMASLDAAKTVEDNSVEELQAEIEAEADDFEIALSTSTPLGFDVCPHCGIHHSNGFATNEDIIDQGGEPNKTHQYICLGCNGEFGPELETEFTLTEAAASLGISPKVARARYRAADNDGKRTFYRFPRSSWDRVIAIISPKRTK